jgi:uncharacterized protein YndB with AHSA1/START domain
MRIERSIEIGTRPERVWAFLTEPEKIRQWSTNFKAFDYTGEQHGIVGARLYAEEQDGDKTLRMSFKITEWVENQRLAFKMTTGMEVDHYEQRWMIEPSSIGTRFTYMESRSGGGLLGKLLEAFGRRKAENAVTVKLSKLKQLIEAPVSAGKQTAA